MPEPDPTPVLVLGAGRFGRLAVDRLRARRRPPPLTVVDRDPGRLADLAAAGVATLAADAVSRVADLPAGEGRDEWIVPAVPVHLACEVVVRRLSRFGPVARPPVPDTVAERVPNPMRGGRGRLYASNADFICPDDCPEPAERCTVTGRPHPVVMFTHLAALDLPGWTVVVVRSRQLAPGLGGFRRSALDAAERRAAAAGGPVLFATACRCHGVVDALDTAPR